jgi:hypothetical protein
VRRCQCSKQLAGVFERNGHGKLTAPGQFILERVPTQLFHDDERPLIKR